METETNNDTAGAHLVKGDRTHWSNVRRSTHVMATKASAGIEEDVCAEQKMKRHQTYLHSKNKREQSKKEKEPKIPGEGVHMYDGQRFGQKLSVSGATMSRPVLMPGLERQIVSKMKDS